MGDGIAENSCCARCWAAHRRCLRTSTSGRCGKCTTRAGSRAHTANNLGSIIKMARPFPHTVMLEQLYEKAPKGSIVSLDAQGHDPDSWSLQFFTSTNREVRLSFKNGGAFSTWNKTLVASLDEEIGRSFSADLKAEEGVSNLIAYAALAGGYAHCLCSTKNSSEKVCSFLDGKSVDSDHASYNVEGNFKCILFSRLGDLIEEIMGAIRQINTMGMPADFYSNAYAAAVILHHEVDYFQSNLRHGRLRSLMSTSLPTGLLTWLISVEIELADHIREGCGRFPSWRSAICGSMKKFRTHRHGETLALSISLHRNMSSTASFDDWKIMRPTPAHESRFSGSVSVSAPPEATFWTTELQNSSLWQPSCYSPTTTTGAFGEMPLEAPYTSSATGIEDGGQMSYHFSSGTENGLSSGNDVQLTSIDPRLVSSDWKTQQGSYVL